MLVLSKFFPWVPKPFSEINDLIAIKYLEALEKVANGQATKIFLPMEASGVLGSIAGVGELFKEKPETE